MLARGFLGSCLVLIGGLVVSPLPGSTPLLDFEPLVAVRTQMPGRMTGLIVVLAGLGLVATAWLSLCRSIAHGPGDDSGIRSARAACLVWSLPLLIAPPLFSRDGWSYAAQATMTHLGASPYQFGPNILSGPILEAVDPRWMATVTPYGPLPLMAGAAFAAVVTGPWQLVIAHRLLALIGLALLAWALPRFAVWAGTNPALGSAAVLASPLMLANGVGGLHNDLLMAGLMAAALVIAAERGWWYGAVLGGLAAAVKLPGGLVCIGVALMTLAAGAPWNERLRRLVGVAAVAVGTLVALGAAGGLGVGWIDALTVPGTVNTPLSVPTVLGGALDATVGRLLQLPDATFLEAFRALGVLAALGFGTWVALQWPTGSRERALAATAAVAAVTVLLSPVVHLWYVLWVVPFAAALRLHRATTIIVYGVGVVGGLAAPLDSSLHGAYVAIIMGCMTAAGMLAIALLTPRARRRLDQIIAPGERQAGTFTRRDTPA
ncbi:polyprenol phosphomannose-dependent alpha 1,6 mannosyltransferase MptB [uncultured Aeromicrobium sp.]|uniref:polyprenol phosphomannose-dependent alpha 1,6 mannosyltransferase MptB n=1 Tax=uncultured Aeromicrobium sp. TaxID=337820 RepID=UPI0025D06AF9|nr:polyprenol phosphomannose-dependent alpha 1,6 mannosyltransferase MptB [uncultured Aeromicrobium sp.]